MPSERQVPPISRLTLRFFRFMARRYFRRHFRSVLVHHPERLSAESGPLIVYGNHSSWWDPMLIVFLAEKLLRSRPHYAPMDAESLERYGILRRIGIFPVTMGSPRGAAHFLRTAGAVLAARGVLWLTPQGRFADPREKPLAFKPGLAALALRHPEVSLVPLAVEYLFWDERLPEALAHVGESFRLPPGLTTAEATELLETRLAESMDLLRTLALARDPSPFSTLLRGSRGTGGIYALIRRAGARLHGRKLQPDHTQRTENPPAETPASRA